MSVAVEAIFILLRVSPWIWAPPLFAAYVLAFVFVVRGGDRIAVADSHSSSVRGSQIPTSH
jgi:hypothetical protein